MALFYIWQDGKRIVVPIDALYRSKLVQLVPAAQIPEAESLEAKLQAALVANQLTHLSLVAGTLVEISIICQACTVADCLDHIVC